MNRIHPAGAALDPDDWQIVVAAAPERQAQDPEGRPVTIRDAVLEAVRRRPGSLPFPSMNTGAGERFSRGRSVEGVPPTVRAMGQHPRAPSPQGVTMYPEHALAMAQIANIEREFVHPAALHRQELARRRREARGGRSIGRRR